MNALYYFLYISIDCGASSHITDIEDKFDSLELSNKHPHTHIDDSSSSYEVGNALNIVYQRYTIGKIIYQISYTRQY